MDSVLKRSDKDWVPTPSEIEQRAAAIRATWSEGIRRSRLVTTPAPVQPPMVRIRFALEAE